MPSGGVVLSPGQHLRALETATTTTPPGAEEEEEEQREGGEEEEEEGEVEEEEVKKKRKGVQKVGEGRDPGWEEQKQPFRLVVVVGGGGADDPGSGGYTPDAMSWQMSPVNGYHTLPAEPVGTAPHNAAATMAGTEDYHPAYILPDSSPAARCLPPVSDYTVVQEVDCQHSLLLNPPLTPRPPLAHQCLPQHPLKALAPVPFGYITPDLLGSITP